MEIERLLKLEKHTSSENEFLEMVISNRIDFYLGDEKGAAVSVKNFSVLAEDILTWVNSKRS